MNPNIFIIEILLIIVALIFIIAGISRKRRVFWIVGILLIIIGNGYVFWMASESIIHYRHLEFSHLSVKDRIGLVFDEFKDPYNPCADTSFDGPVVKHDENSDNNMKRMRNIVYKDFILIFDPQMPSPPFSLTSVEMPQYYFSLSNAAAAIYHAVYKKNDDEYYRMIQYINTSEFEGETAVEFIYGDGKMDFSCPHYFKVLGKAFVTASGKLYIYRDDHAEYIHTINSKDIYSSSPDMDYGIHLMP